MKAEEELDELPDEVDFSRGVRGKFVGSIGREIVTVTQDADVARVFTTAEQINDALRTLVKTSIAADPGMKRKAS